MMSLYRGSERIFENFGEDVFEMYRNITTGHN